MIEYKYRCENGHRFENVASIKSEVIKECLICGSQVKRLIQKNPFGVISYLGQSYYEGFADAHNKFCDETIKKGMPGYVE